MKLYNPFKWHLVQIGNKYALRKWFSIYGWMYLGRFGFDNYFFKYVENYCLHDTKEAAQKRLGKMEVTVL